MWAKFRQLLDEYRHKAILSLVVLAVALGLISELSDWVGSVIGGDKVVAYVTLLLVGDLALTIDEVVRSSRQLQVSPDQDELLPKLLDAADGMRAGESAALLEYAGVSITPLIRKLRDRGAEIQILIKHPEECGRYQRQRTLTNIEALYASVLNGYDGHFEIRCYRAPHGLRGRLIGDELVEVGWLTPDFDRDTAFGRINPSVYANPNTTDGARLQALFTRTFDDVWNHGETVDGRTLIPTAIP